jgi:7,8-dihydropterin-6-yl-methyl-4-(beta-D-ribofuranosyl)aminobenzene 5'-phosphate synthase
MSPRATTPITRREMLRAGGAAALSAVAGGLAGCSAATSPPPSGMDADRASAQLTILYDAFGKSSSMQKDWGYAALVEIGGKRILFDTGNNPEILARNAKAKSIDLSELDFVVMSHRHGDHMGGIPYLLSVNPKVAIYAPKESFGVYGSDLPGAFFRKDPSLPPEQRYYDGTPPAVMRFGSAWPGANVQLIDKTTEIAPGLHLISLVSDKPGTLELRELSVAVDSPEGMVIIVGCSHPGIDRIVEAATAINPRIQLVVGGLHLVVSNDSDIEKIVTALRDRFKVASIAPGHCTGEPTFTALRAAFADRYLYAGLGTTVPLSAASRSKASLPRNEPRRLDESDRRSYRSLLATSHDARPGQAATCCARA